MMQTQTRIVMLGVCIATWASRIALGYLLDRVWQCTAAHPWAFEEGAVVLGDALHMQHTLLTLANLGEPVPELPVATTNALLTALRQRERLSKFAFACAIVCGLMALIILAFPFAILSTVLVLDALVLLCAAGGWMQLRHALRSRYQYVFLAPEKDVDGDELESVQLVP